MRSFPSCWNKTLAQLGFKRKRRKSTQRDTMRRRSLFETLEPRQMLAGDSVDITLMDDYLDATTYAGSQELQRTTKSTVVGDDYVAVNADTTYVFSGEVRSGDGYGEQYNEDSRQYFGFISYDVDKNPIYYYYVNKFGGATDTHLAQPLNPGDTVVYLDDATGWSNGGAGHTRTLAWYGYTNSLGEVYDDFTYTRNVLLDLTNGAWDAGEVDDTANTVTLRDAWTGPSLPAGSAIRNAQSGYTYNYLFNQDELPQDQWAPVSEQFDGQDFRPGTAYARSILLTNHVEQGNLVTWRDVSIDQIDTFQGGRLVDLHVNADTSGTPVTYLWQQTQGTPVTLQDATTDSPTFRAPFLSTNETLEFEVTITAGTASSTDTVQVAIAQTDLVVSTLLDENDGYYEAGYLSLREALKLAKESDGHDTIEFDADLFSSGAATILLGDANGSGAIEGGETPAQLVIDSNVEIVGPGIDLLSLDGGDATRVFFVTEVATASINGLTITGGYAPGAGDGGGIANLGDLKLNSVHVTDNEADHYGGGIYTQGTLLLEDSTVNDNEAVTAGGIFVRLDSAESLTVHRSTIAHNTATGNGGGIILTGGTSQIINSTISNNEGNYGGGIRVLVSNPTALDIINCTITENTALGIGGGIQSPQDATITLHNTILAGNTAGYTSYHDAYGDLSGTGSSHNLIGVGHAGFGITDGDIAGNMIGTLSTPLDPRLSALGDYGGPSQTHALLPTSDAIDAGDDSILPADDLDGDDDFLEPIPFDQRGYTRVIDSDGDESANNVDIGAFESQKNIFQVDTLIDEVNGDYSPGNRSLREAIALAAVIYGTDTITFDPTVFGTQRTITLDRALGSLYLYNNSVNIVGPGMKLLTIDGNAGDDNAPQAEQYPVFWLSDRIVEISGLTITGGNNWRQGGGILSSGTRLTLDDVRLTGNEASGGGGLHQSEGQLTVIRCEIDHNNSTNSVVAAGIAFDGPDALPTVIDSTAIHSNQGLGLAGDGDLTVRNSTISSNTGGGVKLYAVVSESDSAQFLNSTIAYNGSATSLVGGIRFVGDAPVELHNTIVAENKVNGVAYDIYGVYDDSSSNNLFGVLEDQVTSLGLTGAGEYGTPSDPLDPKLAPLGDYGGPTPTHALLSGSLAIDNGNTSAISATTDQRGLERFVGTVDIGAFEWGLEVSTIADESDGNYAPGDLSLREAIELANFIEGDDTITFDPHVFNTTRTILLGDADGNGLLEGNEVFSSLGEFLVYSNTTINGPGASLLTLSGGNISRLFQLAQDQSLTIRDLKLTEGSVSGFVNSGGAISSYGDLTLERIEATNNIGTRGGAIYQHGRSLEIIDSVFDNNQTTNDTFSDGGAIYATGADSVTITGSQITNNTAGEDGGGIYFHNGGALTISDSSITNNESKDDSNFVSGGGGIYVHVYESLQITNSEIAFNEALSATGGGIFITGAASGPSDTFEIVNSSIHDNTALDGAGLYLRHTLSSTPFAISNTTISSNSATDEGGGVYLDVPADQTTPTVVFTNATIAYNTEAYLPFERGAGIFFAGRIDLYDVGSTVGLHNTILAENQNVNGDPVNIDPQITLNTVSSNNLFGLGGSGGLVDNVNGNIVLTEGEDHGLALLNENGGPTLTHALLPNSPAINAGSDQAAIDTGLTTDQTGFERFFNVVDIGAVEAHVIQNADGTLEVYGTDQDDIITVTETTITIDTLGNIPIPANVAGASLVTIHALAGHDQVSIDAGVTTNSLIYGDDGNDTLTGGSGDDTLIGGDHFDTLQGGDGNDTYKYIGSASWHGSDFITEMANSGNDTLDFSELLRGIEINLSIINTFQEIASAGPISLILLNLSDHIENVIGGVLDDTITGNSLNNSLQGGDGDDTLLGMSGDDTLWASAGDDILEGGDDNDTYRFSGSEHFSLETIIETPTGGVDTYDFSEFDFGIGIDFDMRVGTFDMIAPDTPFRAIQINTNPTTEYIENIIGTQYADTITGNHNDNIIEGKGGSDILQGGLGNDTYQITGCDDVALDTILEISGQGSDTLDFSEVNNGITVDLHNYLELENIVGSNYADILTGNSVANVLQGGLGNDTYINTGSDDPAIDTFLEVAAAGTDTLDFSGLNSGVTFDLQTTPQIENIIGTAFPDVLTGNTLGNVIEGRGGSDTLRGGLGNDTYVFKGTDPLGTDSLFEAIGEGIDALDFSMAGQGINLDLNSQTTTEVLPGGQLWLTALDGVELEIVYGTGFDDTIIGNDLDNGLLGYGGDDTIEGGAGDDFILGGDGDDTVGGGDGIDTISGEMGDDQIVVDSSEEYLDDIVSDTDEEVEIIDQFSNVNHIPQLQLSGNVQVDAGSPLSFQLSAVDSDAGQTLSYGALSGLPATASLTPGGLLTWTPTNDDANQNYTILIYVQDNGLPLLRDIGAITVTVNRVLPNTPQGLLVSSETTTTVALTWQASTAADDYRIERRTVGGGWSLTGTASGATTFNDSGLMEGTRYEYRVAATNSAGDSEFSSMAFALTELGAPTGLMAEVQSNDDIQLTWTDDSSNESGFKIEQLENTTSGWMEVGSVGAGVTMYTATGAVADKGGFFRVRAYATDTESDYSNAAADGAGFDEMIDGLRITHPSNVQVVSGDLFFLFSKPGTGKPSIQDALMGESIADAGVGHLDGPLPVVHYDFDAGTLVNGPGDDFAFFAYASTSGGFAISVPGAGQIMAGGSTFSGETGEVYYINGGDSPTEPPWDLLYNTYDLSDLGVADGVSVDRLILYSPSSGDWAGIGSLRSIIAVDITLENVPDSDEESVGGLVAVNSNYDEVNFDSNHEPVADNVEDSSAGHRIIGETDPQLLPATLSLLGSDGQRGKYTLTYDSNIKIWKDNGIGGFTEIVSGIESEEIIISGTEEKVNLWIEGITKSSNPRDVEIRAAFTPTGSDSSGDEDIVKLTVSDVDLDIDSDNNNGVADPEGSDWEEQLEDHEYGLGKLIIEGANTFTPLVLRIPAADPNLTMRFEFSEVSSAGTIRVWTTPQGGQQVFAFQEYTLAELGHTNGEITVYIEGVAENSALNTLHGVEVEGKPTDGIGVTLIEGGGSNYIATDFVKYIVTQTDSFFYRLQFDDPNDGQESQAIRNALASRGVYFRISPTPERADMPEFSLEPLDASELAELGVPGAIIPLLGLASGVPGFGAALYQDYITGGDHQYVLSFAGTDDWKDILDNLWQGIGLYSVQYGKAIDIGEALAEVEDIAGLIVTGHSLGGGLASAASLAGGITADTFNAAGLHAETIAMITNPISTQIDAYYMDWDILSLVQDYSPLIIPSAIGTRHEKDGPYNEEVILATAVGVIGVYTGVTWVGLAGLIGDAASFGLAHRMNVMLYGLLVDEVLGEDILGTDKGGPYDFGFID